MKTYIFLIGDPLLLRKIEEFIPNGKRIFFKTVSPHDTGIPLEHDYIFIKEVDTPNRILYHGGGGPMSYTTFGIWGRGD